MSSPASPEAHFVANNLALDFINTAYGVNEGKHDCLVDDMSVIQWLKAAGQLPADYGKAPAGLTPLARTLRQAAAQLIDAVSAGRSGDTAAVNQLLAAGQPVRRLEWDEEKASFVLVEQRRDDSAASHRDPGDLPGCLCTDRAGHRGAGHRATAQRYRQPALCQLGK